MKKVDEALTVRNRTQRVSVQQDIGSFLKPWMLGVISDMNDMLQDVQGKKSIAEKRKILRGLGALVTHIGTAITNVAPQVIPVYFSTCFCPCSDPFGPDNGNTANNFGGPGASGSGSRKLAFFLNHSKPR